MKQRIYTCDRCGTTKTTMDDKEPLQLAAMTMQLHWQSQRMNSSAKLHPICKECAHKIAETMDTIFQDLTKKKA